MSHPNPGLGVGVFLELAARAPLNRAVQRTLCPSNNPISKYELGGTPRHSVSAALQSLPVFSRPPGNAEHVIRLGCEGHYGAQEKADANRRDLPTEQQRVSPRVTLPQHPRTPRRPDAPCARAATGTAAFHTQF